MCVVVEGLCGESVVRVLGTHKRKGIAADPGIGVDDAGARRGRTKGGEVFAFFL